MKEFEPAIFGTLWETGLKLANSVAELRFKQKLERTNLVLYLLKTVGKKKYNS